MEATNIAATSTIVKLASVAVAVVVAAVTVALALAKTIPVIKRTLGRYSL